MAIKIVIDSTADMPSALVQEYGITVVPLNVHFGTEVFRDSIEISPDEFYKRLASSPKLPTTSQPTVGDFLEVYQELSNTTDEIVSIHVSDKLSGTLNSANQAKGQYTGKARIEIVDSEHVSMGLGMVAIAASKAAQGGASIEDVVKEAKQTISKVQFVGLVDTLEYLEKGGRIGKAQALVGSILRLKPLLTVKNGEVHPLEKIRTRSKGIDRLCDIVKEHAPLESLAVVYTTTPDDAAQLADRLRPLVPSGDIPISQVGPVVGTHAGPGVLGISLTQKI
ncbi:MAG: DegV family protein [Chloroflexota bacterium]|nr:DegV family protein [Chloroflexota bacterium]